MRIHPIRTKVVKNDGDEDLKPEDLEKNIKDKLTSNLSDLLITRMEI